MVLYSFMVKGDYGDVKYWQFSGDGWFSVLFERDIFDDTLSLADAHLSILWRSVKLSLITTTRDPDHRLSNRLFHRHAPRRSSATSGCS